MKRKDFIKTGFAAGTLLGPASALGNLRDSSQENKSVLQEGVVYTFRTYRDRTRIGVIGNAATANREKGERILEAVTRNLSEFLVRESLWEITL